QGVNITSFDEAITIPTELPQAIAIDTPYIIFHEKSVTQVVDPCGGSYYLECLTDDLERAVWAELAKIAALPSFQAALAYMAGTIEEQAHREQVAEDEGMRPVVGKNMGLEGAELFPPVPVRTRPTDVAARTARRRREALAALRARRDGGRVTDALRRLTTA